MDSPRFLTAIFVVLVCQVAASAQPALGLRSSVGALLFSNQNYSSEWIEELAVTRELDSAGIQEVSLSFSNAVLDYSDPWLALNGSSVNSLRGHFQPVLAGYRYYFRPRDVRFRFFSGVDAGSVRFAGAVRSSGPSVGGSETISQETSFTRWRTAAGVSVGGEVNFATRWSVSFSYRYLYVSELGDFAAGASAKSFHGGPVNAHALLLGVSNRF